MKTKVCTKCGKRKPISEFYKDKTHSDEVTSSCKDCRRKFYQEKYRKANKQILRKKYKKFYKKNKDKINERNRKWQKENQERVVNYRLKKYYNLTLKEFNKILKTQKNKCLICQRLFSNIKKVSKKGICVDHNHTTGKVRGLLCNQCNFLLGLANENISILKNAIKYLKGSTK